jgi:ABC-type microcin C transport system duplicated ATPase subunit YejF
MSRAEGMNILEIRGLVVRFGTGRKTLVAVDGIDLDVPRGGILWSAWPRRRRGRSC